jgi:hypothetical protein
MLIGRIAGNIVYSIPLSATNSGFLFKYKKIYPLRIEIVNFHPLGHPNKKFDIPWCSQYIVEDTYPFSNPSAIHQCTLYNFYGKWDNIKTVRGKALLCLDTKIHGTKAYSALFLCDAYGIVG